VKKVCGMNNVEKIVNEIAGLSTDELAAFREWFLEFDAGVWDSQFEADAKAGRLDALAANALKDHAAGRSKEL
jgi:hypothetical protein